MSLLRAVVLVCFIAIGAIACGSDDSGTVEHTSDSTEGAPNAANPSRVDGKPNFVLVNVDDLSTQDMRKLPEITDLVGSQGAIFRNSFVNDPACCPSRTALLRGQYVHNHKVRFNNPATDVFDVPQGGWEGFRYQGHEEDNLATRLQDAGYTTGLYGKYFATYNGSEVPPGWNEFHAWFGNRNTTDSGTMMENGEINNYGDWTEENADQTDIVANKAVRFIEGASQPFFLYVPERAPHSPSFPPKRYEDALPAASLPTDSRSFNENDVSDKPDYIQGQRKLTPELIDRYENINQKRLQSMLAVRDMLERIIDTLESKGQLSNTYIIFTSDNGYHIGQHRMKAGKLTPYEEDIQVPLQVRGPGVENIESTEIVGNQDHMPTLLDLAGAEIPNYVDGRSYAGLLSGNSEFDRSRIMFEQYRRPEGAQEIPTYQGVRTDRYKYVEYETGERELYDLKEDPNELNNLSGDDSVTKKQKALAEKLDALRDCEGEGCRKAER